MPTPSELEFERTTAEFHIYFRMVEIKKDQFRKEPHYFYKGSLPKPPPAKLSFLFTYDEQK